MPGGCFENAGAVERRWGRMIRIECENPEDQKLWNAALYALEYLNDASLMNQLIEQSKGKKRKKVEE